MLAKKFKISRIAAQKVELNIYPIFSTTIMLNNKIFKRYLAASDHFFAGLNPSIFITLHNSAYTAHKIQTALESLRFIAKISDLNEHYRNKKEKVQ